MIDIKNTSWKLFTLGEICGINLQSLSEKTPKDYKFKYIDLSAVSKGSIDIPKQDISFSDAPSRARRIIHKDDIIMSTVRPNLQGFAYINFNADNFICSTGFAVLKAKENISNKYIYQLLYSKEIETQINNMLVGSNYPAINSSDVESLKILLPPLPEQEKIAEILGTCDEAIEKLSKLIEAKKLQKKGLMQQLLTASHRLNGFTKSWKTVRLGEICNICTGKKDVNEGNPCGIYPFFTCANRHTYSDVYSFDKEAILIAGNGDVGNCQYYNGKFEAYQRTYILSEFKINGLLLFQYLTYFFKQYVENQKQQGAMPYIKLNTLTDFKIFISNDIQEQNKILQILRSADEEIDLLNKKLEAFKEQKKGLMQQLLTGKIRVKVDKKGE